jgi:hypothetical protein
MTDPSTVQRYREFVARAVERQESYLFDQPRCRFWPEPSDELMAPAGLRFVGAPDGASAQLPGGATLRIRGVTAEKLARAFALLPCTLSRLVIELGSDAPSVIEQTFSSILFAPLAIAELDAQLSAAEIVRFPGSPYEVVRSYWRNAAGVRSRLLAAETPRDTSELRTLLLELHRLMLLGEAREQRRDSFYLPASALGRKRPEPGSFYESETVLERRAGENILLSGARVAVPLLGGVHYWQLLAESVDDPGALSDERKLELSGLDWGRVVRARAEDESEPLPWFLPPRPLTEAHFAALLHELIRARLATEAGDVPEALARLAALHYRFVRLHPLPSANQSLAMSIVNLELGRLFGAGMPHLLLDQLALRFELGAFQQLFARAAHVWCAPWPTPAERQRQLAGMRAQLEAFVSSLSDASSLLEARALLADATPERRRGQELSLLAPSKTEGA